MIPRQLKVAHTAYVILLVPAYWRYYGPRNFLWFSDLALFGLAPALWREDRRLISMLALCLSWIGFFAPERMRHHLSPRLPVPAPVPAPPPHSPAEQARREACRSWTRAQEVASEQLEALEEWDPTAYTGHGRERGLRQLMAGDPTGDLRRAQAAAIRAATLARTRGDAVEAAKLRALIACGLGHHDAELTQARLLMQLAPRDPTSLRT